jgi:hypothetical protein
LLANGHIEAQHYPLGMVWDEASIVVEHVNRLEATRATLLQMAVSSVLSKEAGKLFREQIQRLNGD